MQSTAYSPYAVMQPSSHYNELDGCKPVSLHSGERQMERLAHVCDHCNKQRRGH